MEFTTVLNAFLLTLIAGLATGIGSFISFFTSRTNTKVLSISLGFSAGVMIYVSFVEIFSKAKISLTEVYGYQKGYIITTIAFFAGMLISALIDKLVPEYENPHEMHRVEEENKTPDYTKLHRMGIFTAIAIGIHNFPEGLATFTAALKDPSLGIAITVAIAIHNIPEGMSVSVPIFFATGSRKKAFIYSFLSGLSEPVGALLGYFLFFKYFTDSTFGIIFAAVGGIMVFISLDELLPSAEKFGQHHLTIYGLLTGMAVMATSLIAFV